MSKASPAALTQMKSRSPASRTRSQEAASGAMITPPAEARIQSIGRAKALLDAMASGGWVSLRDLALETGLAKTTAFNLVSALVDVGLAERDAKAGAYRLSLQHLSYGKAVERRLDIATIARPHLIRLCALTRETVNLALPGPIDSLIVESLEGSQTLRVSSYAGTRASYHSTACGRALLAYQPARFRRTIYDLGRLSASTHRTITDPEILESVLEECRTLGWTSEFEENELGGACVAAPIFGPRGEVIAAVSIAGPAARFTRETMARLGSLLVNHLAEISAEISQTPPTHLPRAIA
ncbi:IclR family transcriptional regulator [Microvirga brassicacearum]|nr:IclR family transcriptional regulator [Microvirga brassicacearum]